MQPMFPDIVGDSYGAPVYSQQSSQPPGLPTGAQVRDVGSVVARQQIAGGARVTVAGAGSGSALIKVQSPFRANFLVAYSLTKPGASQCILTSLKVGQDEQLVGEVNEVPIEMLSQDNLLGRLAFHTAVPGVQVIIALSNLHATEAETLFFALWGVSLRA